MATAYKKIQKKSTKPKMQKTAKVNTSNPAVVREIDAAARAAAGTGNSAPKMMKTKIAKKKVTGGPVYETPGFKPGTRNLKKY